MTRQDIIETAFRVWGRQSYQSTSLTDVARELGVSKPSLYRHFKNKKALFDALFESFFDRYAAFVKPFYEKAVAVLPNETECLSIMTTAVAEYFIRNANDFIFSVIEVLGKEETGGVPLLKRGIDMGTLVKISDKAASVQLQLIMATAIFVIAGFHKHNSQAGETPSEEKIEQICRFIVQKIRFGLELDKEMIERIEKMNYTALERRITETLDFSKLEENKDAKRKNLLDAVCAAVAEAGPWKVSMDLAARKSGLSKSSLYSYFTSKDDMLEQFFVREFDRLVSATKKGKALSDKPEEQFYLIIAVMAEYLRSRPDLLATINWLKMWTDEFMINWRRARSEEYDVEETFRNPRFSALFSDILSKIAARNIGKDGFLFPNIVPFLVVNVLVSGGGGHQDDGFHRFRVLFEFLTLGIDNRE
jgi:AcrR family transcriptional regulator